jgi:hypothetical protein
LLCLGFNQDDFAAREPGSNDRNSISGIQTPIEGEWMKIEKNLIK